MSKLLVSYPLPHFPPALQNRTKPDKTEIGVLNNVEVRKKDNHSQKPCTIPGLGIWKLLYRLAPHAVPYLRQNMLLPDRSQIPNPKRRSRNKIMTKEQKIHKRKIINI